MTEPVDHVIRPPLPWRGDSLTECGKPVDGNRCITIEELTARLASLGHVRTVFTCCVTCCKTIDRTRIHRWEDNPVGVMRRELERVGHGPRGDILRQELLAIAMLVDAHRDEFTELMAGLSDTTNLTARRPRRARRTADGGRVHDA
jgi:hypothetical protein